MNNYCEYHRMILELVDYALDSNDEKIVALAKYAEELIKDNRQMDFDLNFTDKNEFADMQTTINAQKEKITALEKELDKVARRILHTNRASRLGQ